MTADFSGRWLPLPPGIHQPPSFTDDIAQPCWVSPASTQRLLEWAEAREFVSSSHVVVGGRTIWIDNHEPVASMVLSHPNRLGAAEDLEAVVALADRLGSKVWVEVDPYLVALVELEKPLLPVVRWMALPPLLRAVGERCRLAADAFRRRAIQIPQLKFVVDQQAGRAVALVTPIPGELVVARLAAGGVLVDALPLWEGMVVVSLGWWHTRRQIDQLVHALAAIIARQDVSPIDDDRFDHLPEDLPKRQLDTL